MTCERCDSALNDIFICDVCQYEVQEMRICRECGVSICGKHLLSKYCTIKCRTAAQIRRDNVIGGKKMCPVCNVSFYGIKGRKYCSQKCANANKSKQMKAIFEYFKEGV